MRVLFAFLCLFACVCVVHAVPTTRRASSQPSAAVARALKLAASMPRALNHVYEAHSFVNRHARKRAVLSLLSRRAVPRRQTLASSSSTDVLRLEHILSLLRTSRVSSSSSSSSSLATRETVAVRQGLNGDVCSSNDECLHDRTCVHTDGNDVIDCSPFAKACSCLAAQPFCQQHDDCSPGELCNDSLCRSDSSLPPAAAATDERDTTARADDTQSAATRQAGLNFDTCESDLDCAGERKCVELTDNDDFRDCFGGTDCYCFTEEPFCATDDDCQVGEVCNANSVCLSESASQGNIPVIAQPPATTPPETTEAVEQAEQQPKEVPDAEPQQEEDEQDQPEAAEQQEQTEPETEQTDTTEQPSELASEPGEGLNFMPCTTGSDCTASRFCAYAAEQGFEQCIGREGCVCLSREPGCSTTSDCSSGERCVSLSTVGETETEAEAEAEAEDGEEAEAVERQAEEGEGEDEAAEGEGEDEAAEGEGEDEGETEAAEGEGETEAAEGEGETEAAEGEGEAEEGENTSWCIAESVDLSSVTLPASVIAELVPEEEEVDDRPVICIGAHQLHHMESHQLLYKNHMPARVLCDEQNSCATPGHIVQYRGTTMMMKNYCLLVSCERRIMLVNSPKYRRALRVDSLTQGLQYTAFAARYESMVEERVLTGAVRMGL